MQRAECAKEANKEAVGAANGVANQFAGATAETVRASAARETRIRPRGRSGPEGAEALSTHDYCARRASGGVLLKDDSGSRRRAPPHPRRHGRIEPTGVSKREQPLHSWLPRLGVASGYCGKMRGWSADNPWSKNNDSKGEACSFSWEDKSQGCAHQRGSVVTLIRRRCAHSAARRAKGATLTVRAVKLVRQGAESRSRVSTSNQRR